MKTRWMKSVVEHSKTPAPALPYARGSRRLARAARLLNATKPRKTA